MTMNHRCFALLPCAGVGARAQAQDARGSQIPKQYQQVFDRPLVQHTLDALLQVPELEKILVVLAPNDEYFERYCRAHERVVIARCGGATRAETVANGLQHLRTQMQVAPGEWVLVHDAARCLIRPDWVQKLLQACWQADEGGLLAVPVADTLKMADSSQRVAHTVERAGKWLAQTPQMFRHEELQAALAASGSRVSDEASAMEEAGYAPLLVQGHTHNVKVTYPEDFALAASILALRKQGV